MTTIRSFDARFIRLRDAARYLGMDKNRFNVDVRPFLTEIPIGVQGIAFDRLELDAWADDYKAVRGRPPEKEASCLEKKCRASPIVVAFGTSISESKDTGGFQKAVERIALARRSGT
jgi:predicted DNA-binding transcriptional regulator AlpA